MNLEEYLRGHKETEELQQLYNNMSLSLKDIHEKGWHIKTCHFKEFSQNVMVDGVKNKIIFNSNLLEPINSKWRNQFINNDILNLAVLSVGIYADCIGPITVNTLINNFSLFESYIPSEDVNYYNNLFDIKRNNTSNFINNYQYYSDFRGGGIEKRSNNPSSENSKSLSLTTPYYKGEDSNNQQNPNAFVSLFLFPAIIFYFFLMFGITYWILVIR